MFKFNFDLNEDDLGETVPRNIESSADSQDSAVKADSTLKPFVELSLDNLLDTLPSLLSYSPLSIPLSNGETVYLPRRDLFDARFQLISQGTPDGESEPMDSTSNDLEYLEAPSDLVPGIYEGGLKTWECSVDLAASLSDIDPVLEGKKVLEIGCGTTVPSLFLLHKYLHNAPPDHVQPFVIHLQDYNDLVFRLVTVPNIFLIWYFSSASQSYRQDTAAESPESSQAGELSITPELLSAFKRSLQELKISIRLFSGSWDTFDFTVAEDKYDIVLTSETIYRIDSLPSLIDLMKRATTGQSRTEDESLAKLSESHLVISERHSTLCLVAAKLVYFGVGGGVLEFINAVNNDKDGIGRKGKVETIWEHKEGVKRSVMKVSWT